MISAQVEKLKTFKKWKTYHKLGRCFGKYQGVKRVQNSKR